MTVRTAVITAAGYGTRFLPITKAVPKEMLPLVDRPVIHYAVEQAVEAGIERIILNLRAQGVEATSASLDVVTIPLGEAGAAWAMRVAAELRRAGLTVRGGTPGRSLRAQLRAANGSGARYVAIAGDEEAAQQVVQLKELAEDGEQRTLALDALLGALAPAAAAARAVTD